MKIYTGGAIYAGRNIFTEAFSVENGRFADTGALRALREKYPRAEIVNLSGPFTCAGFNDSHMHVLGYGRLLEKADLSSRTGSMDEVVRAVSEYAAAHPDPEWVYARGWNDTYFSGEKRFPDRRDLDRVSLTRPVLAYRACGHILSCNSAALKRAGVTKDTPQPEGGAFDRDAFGEPTGVFRENAISLITRFLPAPDKAACKRRIENACRALNVYGVTSAQTDDLCVPGVPDETVLGAFCELESEGKLTVRICQQAQIPEIGVLRDFLSSGTRERLCSDFFRIGPLKLVLDGSLGAKTAFMTVPYSGSLDSGMPLFTQAQLDELALTAHESGMPLAMHAIGDAAIDMALSCVARAKRLCPDAAPRHGIVHCQITRPDQLARICELGMTVYAQPIFLDYDLRIVKDRVGAERAASSYAFGTLTRMGVPTPFGSDCPVEKPDVLRGMQCAVTRATIDRPDCPDRVGEAVTVTQAIDAYTLHGAAASGEETKKGMIAPGMLADFTTLDKNPLLCPPCALHEIRVIETHVGGVPVFGATA